MIKKLIKSNPNTITSFNLISGLIATYFAFNFSNPIGDSGLYGYHITYLAIAAAALFDFCDGLSARLLGAYSNIGKELDSLADLVSFGVAPAMLMLNILLSQTSGNPVSFIALFIPVMGAFRLAKFNVDDTQKTSFSGLPIPANAIFWIGFAEFTLSEAYPLNIWVNAAIIVFVSCLMVSRMRMFSLKFKNLKFKENFSRYVLIILAVVNVVFYGVQGFMWTIIFYILLSAVSRKSIE